MADRTEWKRHSYSVLICTKAVHRCQGASAWWPMCYNRDSHIQPFTFQNIHSINIRIHLNEQIPIESFVVITSLKLVPKTYKSQWIQTEQYSQLSKQRVLQVEWAVWGMCAIGRLCRGGWWCSFSDGDGILRDRGKLLFTKRRTSWTGSLLPWSTLLFTIRSLHTHKRMTLTWWLCYFLIYLLKNIVFSFYV